MLFLPLRLRIVERNRTVGLGLVYISYASSLIQGIMEQFLIEHKLKWHSTTEYY